jgi:ketosteroid isomerase-like protein
MNSRRFAAAFVLCAIVILSAAAMSTHAVSFSSRPATAVAPAVSPEAELTPILDQMEKIANAHDVDAFMNFYEKSPSMVFVFNGSEIHGFDALRADQAKWWQDGKSDATYTREAAPEFTVLGPNAAVVTLEESSTRTLPDGAKTRGTVVITEVFDRRPEGWRIVYSHESTPH